MLFSVASYAAFLTVAPAQEPEPASRVYAQAAKSVFLISVRSATGEPLAQATGFLIPDNRIVTNNHVIRAGTPFLDLGTVRLSLKTEHVDEVNDLAVLTPVGELSAPPLRLAQSQPKPGTAIYVIGNPQGLERSISSGIVAGVREASGKQLLQISAPISPGSSGGPVLNGQVEVVAVTVGALESGQNLNFAVPVNLLQRLLTGDKERADVPSMLSRVQELRQERSQQDFSESADSPYQHLTLQIGNLLTQALTSAASDASQLALVGETALVDSPEIAVSASEKMAKARPSAEANFLLARSLQAAYIYEPSGTDAEKTILARWETAARAALRMSRQPTVEMYSLLAEALEHRAENSEAIATYTKVYTMAKAQNDTGELGNAARGLTRVWYQLVYARRLRRVD